MLGVASVLVLAALASSAAAGPFGCPPGAVGYLGVDRDGTVVTNVGYGTIRICGTHTSFGGAPPETCRVWYSTLMTARATGKKITLYFNSDEPVNAGLVPGQCTAATFGDWANRVPYFFQIDP